MRLKILSVLSAVALVAACSSTPQEGAESGGTGTQQTSTAPSVTAEKMGPKAGTPEDFVVNVGDRVHFGFDRYDLESQAQSTLNAQAAWLKRFPAVTLTIEGHCDERGTREYNLALGERRAAAVKDYLVALGVNPNRLRTLSYGKERPVALGHNEAAWSQNRRAVSTIAGGAGS